jgi:hypothetical protein
VVQHTGEIDPLNPVVEHRVFGAGRAAPHEAGRNPG